MGQTTAEKILDLTSKLLEDLYLLKLVDSENITLETLSANKLFEEIYLLYYYEFGTHQWNAYAIVDFSFPEWMELVRNKPQTLNLGDLEAETKINFLVQLPTILYDAIVENFLSRLNPIFKHLFFAYILKKEKSDRLPVEALHVMELDCLCSTSREHNFLLKGFLPLDCNNLKARKVFLRILFGVCVLVGPNYFMNLPSKVTPLKKFCGFYANNEVGFYCKLNYYMIKSLEFLTERFEV